MLNDSTRKQYLTQNGYSRSLKVICFDVDGKPLTIHQRYRQTERETDGRTDGQTDNLSWQYRATLRFAR